MGRSFLYSRVRLLLQYWLGKGHLEPSNLEDSSGASIGADAVDVRKELKVCHGDGSSIPESFMESLL
jgi:hypothetical protein